MMTSCTFQLSRGAAASACIAVALMTGSTHAADPAGDAPYLPHAGKQMFHEADIYGGWTWRGGDAIGSSEDDTYGLIGGGGKIGWYVPEGHYLQFDLDLEGTFASAAGDSYLGSIQGIVHVGHDFGPTMRAGLFGGIAQGFDEDDDDSATIWMIGPEVEYRTGAWILTAQGGYLDVFNPDGDTDEALGNAWFLRGVAAYFLNSGMTRVHGEILGAFGEQDFTSPSDEIDDMTVFSLGLEIEHQLHTLTSGAPVSVFAAFRGTWYEEENNTDTDRIDDQTVMIGLRIRNGGGTLHEALTHGTSLGGPMFGALSQGATAID